MPRPRDTFIFGSHSIKKRTPCCCLSTMLSIYIAVRFVIDGEKNEEIIQGKS